jgi:hypothetical protein
MAVPLLLYGTDMWTVKKRDWNRIQAAGMAYQRLHWNRSFKVQNTKCM